MLAMQHRRTRTRARVSVRPAVLHGGMRRVHSSVRRVGGSDALYREGVQRVRDPSPRLVDVRRVRAESPSSRFCPSCAPNAFDWCRKCDDRKCGPCTSHNDGMCRDCAGDVGEDSCDDDDSNDEE